MRRTSLRGTTTVRWSVRGRLWNGSVGRMGFGMRMGAGWSVTVEYLRLTVKCSWLRISNFF